ncbi:thioredoxin-disulfide reductase [Helicobacter monodelphidis]|uniref:thioredoxin-disulfide reductase n=1 Tax=Helicobacter sp. 15-1451 TaxID=2004995 RepID=UPI000DCE766C|nr:thioredoxin-disulfide reductase [Helicobacter sp. 15-1451]RAX57782.1 thioredoxin-disulfide reductase [Helicobacter sp. 15-1451]
MLDVAIIGGGPAGLTAGLYTTRGGAKEVVMFERGMPGGQITGSSEIENYPGVKEVLSGFDFMQPWQEQCFRFGLKSMQKDVMRISRLKNYFVIHTDKETFEAKSVIVATGGSPKRSGVKGEDQFYGRGISTCATCDGFFYKGEEVAVLGGGDTAIEEALFLSELCKKVTVLHRRDEFRAAPVTLQKAKAKANIEFLTPVLLDEILGDAKGVNGILYKYKDSQEQQKLEVNGLFIFVGYSVNNQILKQEDGSFLCEMTDAGEVKVDLNMNTNVPGLFAAGDIRIQAAKQVVCAAGDGARAALSALAYLEHHM